MTATILDDPVSPSQRTEKSRGQSAAGSWTRRLLDDDRPSTWNDLARRLTTGLGLCALYGVAIGARHGGRALLQHAVGVPMGIVLVALAGAPSVFVLLSLCRAPIDARTISVAVVGAVARVGVLLAGLAPAAALFVVSSESPVAAAGAVKWGLLLGGGIALGRMVSNIGRRALSGGSISALGGAAVGIGFTVFAATLAARVWTALLPILGGMS